MNKKDIILNGLVSKGANVAELSLNDSELEKINSMTLEPLTADDVFVFKVAICDNEVDRQYERFTLKALDDMSELFIGKPLIKDHDRKADNQIGRIYDTEVIAKSDETTEQGEPYTMLVAHCYVLNTETNKDLIAEIKGGIKKEVSVNARVGKAVCNICGTDNAKEYCEHWWGQTYDGVKCYFTLDEAQDAFELSFVAVPAQAKAGTMKEHNDKEKPIVTKDNEEQEVSNDIELEFQLKTMDTFIYIQNQKLEKE